jgi:hypothetical protein
LAASIQIIDTSTPALALDTRDVLQWRHSMKRIKKSIGGEIMDSNEEVWSMVGELQLMKGEVPNLHHRKTIIAM